MIYGEKDNLCLLRPQSGGWKLRGFFKRFKKPKANISVSLSKNTFTPGEDLTGTFFVTSNEMFDAEEIRAEFECVESKEKTEWEWDEDEKEMVENTYTETETLHHAKLELSGPLRLASGFKKELPFSTKIPASGRETYDSIDASVEWKIKGVINVKGRPDVTTGEIGVEVVKAPREVIKEKIVEKVIMLPCAYCNSLMPQTSTMCPHCGARRRG